MTDSARDSHTPLSDWAYLAQAAIRLTALVSGPTRAPNEYTQAFKDLLQEGNQLLNERFKADEPIENLVHDRAHLIDIVLRSAWRRWVEKFTQELSLIAVGGYGRGELHPCSDIDIMVLLPKFEDSPWQSNLEKFLTFLWDIGLEVGHSVRTIDDCQREALDDISVATTLMEARLIDGPPALFTAMRRALSPARIWPPKEFYDGKVAEQTQRHVRFFDTAYNLEPNIKASPGGLRDIQTIAWVAKRHFGADTLDDLVTHGFLTPSELKKLKNAQMFLWKIRFALHQITQRREDRLLFDHQIRIAQLFGYEDATYTLAVEQLMQRYYRTAMDIALLNEMLLQLFREAVLQPEEISTIVINPRFQVCNDYLEVTADDVFEKQPSAMLEMFQILCQNEHLRGVRASTIRLVQSHLWLIDEEFRQNPRHHRLFLELLREPVGVTHAFRRMNLYGVLGRYIPSFGRIVGRMQYDLFHAYTVDAHTLFVVRNLRRMSLERHRQELPKLNDVFKTLPSPELAYLAGLFHDIAKGRGGDHSELGAVDAEAFCLEQGLSRYDARLVAWLVRHHLDLSVTAQKKDISDVAVINDFARKVGDQTHLDYLYVLTVADVRGTNPKLWNTWKASLFEEFYERIKRALRQGLESPLGAAELINETKTEVMELLKRDGYTDKAIERVWLPLSEAYFLRHTADEIAWHTTLLAERDSFDEDPVVSVRQETGRGGTAIFVFSRRKINSFARTTAILDQMGLTVLDARITLTQNDFSVETYLVLENNGGAIVDRGRMHEIRQGLLKQLSDETHTPTVTRRAPRQTRLFATPTQISFSQDPNHTRTVLELVAADRPGLLSDVGKVFVQHQLQLHGARIVTVGERAEDVFYISDTQDQPLDRQRCDAIAVDVKAALDKPYG